MSGPYIMNLRRCGKTTWLIADLRAENARLREALEQVFSMTEELADSRYAKYARGGTLGAEVNRIARTALASAHPGDQDASNPERP